MVAIDRSTTVVDGVTLVRAVVTGDARPRRVRIANRLDGPVWPPRRAGRPEAGWDDEGCTLRVPADGRVAVGYASPADPVDPPVTVASVEAVADDDVASPSSGRSSGTDREDADAAIRALGDPAPPRDAVPLPAPAEGDAQTSAATERDDAPPAEPGAGVDGDGGAATRSPPPAVPDPVEAWLDDVDERLTRLEEIADAESVPAVTGPLADAGGLEAVAASAERTSAEAAALRRVAARAGRLADRAEAVDVPIERLWVVS